MRSLEKLIEQPQLIQDPQGRRVHRVTPKVPQEVRVLLEHDDPQARPREEVARHQAGGTAARNAQVPGARVRRAQRRR